jgi:CDP-diglyceride synthetase
MDIIPEMFIIIIIIIIIILSAIKTLTTLFFYYKKEMNLQIRYFSICTLYLSLLCTMYQATDIKWLIILLLLLVSKDVGAV